MRRHVGRHTGLRDEKTTSLTFHGQTWGLLFHLDPLSGFSAVLDITAWSWLSVLLTMVSECRDSC